MFEEYLSQLAAELLTLEKKRRSKVMLSPTETARRELLTSQLMQDLNEFPGAERRRYLRIPATITIGLKLDDIVLPVPSYEMSLGGLGVAAAHARLFGSSTSIEIARLDYADTSMTLNHTASVIRDQLENGQVRIGLSFGALNNREKKQIRSLFDRVFVDYLEKLACPIK